jgi:transposase-like protein
MMKEQAVDGFYSVRCPRCKEYPKKIGEYSGTPCENFEVGFWCKKCKKSILISWVKTSAGFEMKWRVRGES